MSKSDDSSKTSQASIHDEAAAALKRLETKDPGLKQFLKKAYAYAVFPSVGKAALVVGGGYGRGLVFERGKPAGYATISKMTLGVDLGGNTFIELIALESEEVFERFKRGKYAFAADASIVVIKAGASATANFEHGAVTFAYSSGGLKLEAAIGGQKFKFKPLSDEDEQDQDRDDEDADAEASADQGEADDHNDDGDEESSDDEDGPSLSERAGAGLKAAQHLKSAFTGGKIRKAFGLWGAARQLKVAAAGASSGTRDFVKRRPITSALIGGGLAAGAILGAAALMGAFASDQQESERDQSSEDDRDDAPSANATQDQDDDENDAQGRAQDEAEGEEDRADEDEGPDGESEEEDEMPRRMASRGRARA